MQFDPATHPLRLDKQTRKNRRVEIERNPFIGQHWWFFKMHWNFVKIQCTLKQLERKTLHILAISLCTFLGWLSCTLFQRLSDLQASWTKRSLWHPSWCSTFHGSRLRQPEANATIGKHVGLLVAPVKSKDRAQAKVMTDYQGGSSCRKLAEVWDISSIQGTNDHISPASRHSWVDDFPAFPWWDMWSFPGGYRNVWDLWKDLTEITDIYHIIIHPYFEANACLGL